MIQKITRFYSYEFIVSFRILRKSITLVATHEVIQILLMEILIIHCVDKSICVEFDVIAFNLWLFTVSMSHLNVMACVVHLRNRTVHKLSMSIEKYSSN